MSHPRPRKRFGQNFLTDGGAIARIVRTVSPQPGEPVLEIGPGRGALTAALWEALAALTAEGSVENFGAVEIDRDLALNLRERFPKLQLYSNDVLDLSLGRVRSDLDPDQGRRLQVVGNLPYNISKPIAMKLVQEREHVEHAVLMFQKEVGNRLIAEVGSKDYGPLTVLTGLAFDIRRVFDLGPRSFRPRPAVDSTVTEWRRRPESPLTPDNEALVRRCLLACFARRRQTLRNNLRAALADRDLSERVLESAGLDPAERAERVSAEAFLRLASVWPDSGSSPDFVPHAKRERKTD